MRSLGPVLLMVCLVVGMCSACTAEPVIQTVEVPVTVVMWQTVEVPVTILAVQTVEGPVTVEVVRTVLVTPQPADTPAPSATQPAAAAAIAAPTSTLALPTESAAGPSAEVQSYLAIARPQCTEIFGCLSDMAAIYGAPEATLARVSGRVAAVRNVLNSTTPPAELAEAHHLMLSACGYLDGALQKAYAGDSAQEPLDRGYEDNVAAENLLKAAAGENRLCAPSRR